MIGELGQQFRRPQAQRLDDQEEKGTTKSFGMRCVLGTGGKREVHMTRRCLSRRSENNETFSRPRNSRALYHSISHLKTCGLFFFESANSRVSLRSKREASLYMTLSRRSEQGARREIEKTDTPGRSRSLKRRKNIRT
jgi:hypothetical protein